MSADIMVRDLRKSYRDVAAVNDVSLDVSGGEIFGLLGPNGAGKTTTLECILGLRLPDAGSITIAGIDALAKPERVKQLIGAQLQATSLQDKITPREALKFFGAFYRKSIKTDQLIERFSLGEKADAPFDTLSAGQKQRLSLALAFVNDPRFVFLDEPTAGLDPQSRRELHEDILKLKEAGCTVVLSTHYIEEAERLCDRVAIINAGRIVATDTPGGLVKRAEIPDHVIVQTMPVLSEAKFKPAVGSDQAVLTDAGWRVLTRDINRLVISIVRLIEAEGVALLDLQIHRALLEDAFLKLIADA